MEIDTEINICEKVNCPNCTGQAILIDTHPNIIGDVYKCLQCTRLYSKAFISGYQKGLIKGQTDSKDTVLKLRSQLLESRSRVENLTLKNVKFQKQVQIAVQTQGCLISASDAKRIIAETHRRSGIKFDSSASPKNIDGTFLVWTGAKIHRKTGTPPKYYLMGYSGRDVSAIIEWLHGIPIINE